MVADSGNLLVRPGNSLRRRHMSAFIKGLGSWSRSVKIPNQTGPDLKTQRSVSSTTVLLQYCTARKDILYSEYIIHCMQIGVFHLEKLVENSIL